MTCIYFLLFFQFPFHFVDGEKVLIEAHKILIWMTLNLSFFFPACAFSVTSRKQLPNLRLRNFTSGYIVLALTLMSIPHFELIFVYW